MRRYQIMKRSEPDDMISCNTSYLPRNITDACSALRHLGYGDMLIALHDVLSDDYALIKTPLSNMWNSLEYVIAQICGCENTAVHTVKKYAAAKIMVLDVTLTNGYFETNNIYEFYDGRLVHYTPKGGAV